MPPLGESDKYGGKADARVVGWVSQDGTIHTVENQYGETVSRRPSDHSLEHAKQVRIAYNSPSDNVEYVSVENLTPDYTIDDAIDEITDSYFGSRQPS